MSSKKAETSAARKKFIDQALTELKMHAILEEEIFYPTVRRQMGNKVMNEAEKEEEDEMLPKAKELNIDFEQLGQRMLERKQQLLKNGIPPDAEHAMVANVGGNADSPARAAARREKAPVSKKSAKSRVKSRSGARR